MVANFYHFVSANLLHLVSFQTGRIGPWFRASCNCLITNPIFRRPSRSFGHLVAYNIGVFCFSVDGREEAIYAGYGHGRTNSLCHFAPLRSALPVVVQRHPFPRRAIPVLFGLDRTTRVAFHSWRPPVSPDAPPCYTPIPAATQIGLQLIAKYLQRARRSARMCRP